MPCDLTMGITRFHYDTVSLSDRMSSMHDSNYSTMHVSITTVSSHLVLMQKFAKNTHVRTLWQHKSGLLPTRCTSRISQFPASHGWVPNCISLFMTHLFASIIGSKVGSIVHKASSCTTVSDHVLRNAVSILLVRTVKEVPILPSQWAAVKVVSQLGTEFWWSAYLCVHTCLSGVTVLNACRFLCVFLRLTKQRSGFISNAT